MRTRWMMTPVLAAAIAIAPLAGTAAHAQTPPPPAWTCDAVVTGVQVPHQVLPSLATTAAVHSLTGTVTCELTGVLTTAPVDYLPLYGGGISLHVHSSQGDNKRCVGDSLVPGTSAGPTLVMVATAVCTWDPDDSGITYWPFIYWSTGGLDGTNVTIHGKPGTFVAL